MNLAEFGVRKPVVANLVMFAVIGAGLIFGIGLRREFFPKVDPTRVIISAPYPGAAPDEVERALAVKIEDRIADMTDVIEVQSTIAEGGASLIVEFDKGINIDTAVADVKRELDSLQDLPEGADRITVDKLEPNLPAIAIALYGDAPERVKKDFVRGMRDDLRTISGMGDITISGVRRDEIVVEPSPEALLRHNLSLADVADRITAAMRELPGGSVRTDRQSVSIRTLGIEERASAVQDIVVKAQPGGQVVRVGDIASVTDGFVDQDLRVRLFHRETWDAFNGHGGGDHADLPTRGKPAASLTAFQVGDTDIIEIAEIVKAYVAGRRGEEYDLTLMEKFKIHTAQPGTTPDLGSRHDGWAAGHARWLEGPPPGELVVTTDLARFVVGRLELLTRNALQGGVLVFLVLLLLLNWRISFWVAVGLVVSILGTLAFMAMLDVTLNLLTMFGLIIVMGILVDDAIVVAENIASRHESGEPSLVAAVNGTRQVLWPVVATVLTTIFAFLPLALVEGELGDFLGILPVVVACALSVSLIESLFVLPVHMGHSLRAADKARTGRGVPVLSPIGRGLDAFRIWLFDRAIAPGYSKLLALAVEFRYVSVAIAIAVLLGSVGLVASGRVGFILFENNDAETVNVQLRMPIGTSADRTNEIVERIEASAIRQPEIKAVWVTVGSIGDVEGRGSNETQGHLAQMFLEFYPVEQRDRTSLDVVQTIRDEVGTIAGVKSLRFDGLGAGPGGPALTFTVAGSNPAAIDRVVDEVKALMAERSGVIGIADDADRGQRELRVSLRPGASELGFTQASLGRQLQGMVFGIEAFTFAGDREDVDVRVLMPERVRRSLAEIESSYVFTPDGTPVPLAEVAYIDEEEGYATIRRLDRERAVTVSADVREGINGDEIAAALVDDLRAIEARHPGVRILERGRQEEFNDSMESLPVGMLIACGLIYVVLAWLFGSFVQPLAVMSAIPFAIVGMIWGHLVLAFDMTFLSLIGFVALSGIVVNDSLILMEFFNEQRREGKGVRNAALAAGAARVRAIILTTVTTVFGLLPLMLEQSFQARFLIPMAITIACGLLSATVVILVVLPCLLMIMDDLLHAFRVLWSGNPSRPRHNPFVPDHELELLDEQPADAALHDPTPTRP